MVVAAMLLACAVHPLLTYPLSLRLFVRARPVMPAAALPSPAPSLAICMCAYNEQDVIAAKVERLIEVAAAYGPATIHVYADSPQDGTVAILERYADRIDLVVGAERAGKTFGMNLLVARSRSDYILFTDANVESQVDVAIRLARWLADPSVGCATARLIYSNSDETATAALGSGYWQREEQIKRIESDRMGLIGCDGAMFMMRRALHRAPPPHLIDDLFLSLTILIAGKRIISADDVEVYERSATGANEEKRRKQRIACQALNVHRAMWPQLRRMRFLPLYAYVSHRPMKWLMPFFVAGAALCAALGFALAAGWAVTGALALLAAVLLVIGEKTQAKPLSLASSAVLSLYGVGVGVIESVFMGKTYTVWDPALSVRVDPQPSATDAVSR
jgi:cellulose synthase/poly-beta-1,6-N-acetylglucosamine synthase-like glycosyltransferase